MANVSGANVSNGFECLIDTEKEGGCYFRFRNSIRLSGVVAVYSNPFSISGCASLAVCAVLHIHSSFRLYSVASRSM